MELDLQQISPNPLATLTPIYQLPPIQKLTPQTTPTPPRTLRPCPQKFCYCTPSKQTSRQQNKLSTRHSQPYSIKWVYSTKTYFFPFKIGYINIAITVSTPSTIPGHLHILFLTILSQKINQKHQYYNQPLPLFIFNKIKNSNPNKNNRKV